MSRDLTLYLQEILQAVKRIPDDVREYEPAVPWRKIAGLRDDLSHECFGVDTEIIWKLIETRLGELEESTRRLQQMQRSEPDDTPQPGDSESS